MTKLKIKKGDMVEIIAGDDKGKKAKVLAVYPKTMQVVVEGCKLAKKAVKPSEQNQSGGFKNVEMPIHISNVRIAEGA
ncbi:MAG: 50S ribosomal protein L24 [Campylobacterales bacterium]|jgi:large subunit ribosomal protein L24|nr:50S ribosomal protein L24 [Campylobacterales bacterium]